jgi:ubiquinone/menaquinone biosynthesis C-methylase UbiE
MENKIAIKDEKNLDKLLKTPLKINATIEVIPPKKVEEQSILLGMKSSDIPAVGSFLTVLISLILAGTTIRKYSKDHAFQLKQIASDKCKNEIVQAKEKIEKFYGPINSLLEESRLIYEHFAINEKKILREAGSYFRTLRFLTEDTNNSDKGMDRLAKHDQELFKHILLISDKIVDIIETQSGFIDNPALHILLGKLAAHYRIIKSASEGHLTDQSEHLENIVFPLEVNGAINSEINKLLRTIKSPQKNNTFKINKTITFYDDNHITYNNSTRQVDMKEIYEKVRKHVSNGSNILDAGCGVGRDTQYFIKHGFKVTSFDASLKMVELCNEYPFSFCEHKSFATISYAPVFDLIWACASLLHLNSQEFPDVLERLYRALKPGGYLYFSLKKVISVTKKDMRDFYTYSDDYVDELLINSFKMEKVEVWDSGSNLTAGEVFVNYLYKK